MEKFNFSEHRAKAIESYQREQQKYELLANSIRKILAPALSAKEINIHKIEARAKDIDSFAKKASKASDENPEAPKYPNPLKDITDLAGVRVITFLPKDLKTIDSCIHEEFDVIEKTDKSEVLEEQGKFGYKSIHYLVNIKQNRTDLPEYRELKGLTAEIQARTILQHAWAEMEHDIQYKSPTTIPASIKRRFVSLAGMLEIADREFQAIQDEDIETRKLANEHIQAGNFSNVEITPDALKSYLDKKFSPDKRMNDFSYELLAEQLIQIGFKNFKQIDDCIAGFDSTNISRTLWGSKQGQILRFEDTLLAGMGDNFLKLHPWRDQEWFIKKATKDLEELRKNNIVPRSYSPQPQ